MSLNDVVMILLTILGAIITGIAAYFLSEFKSLREAVEQLNVQIAQVLLKVETHEVRIERLEERL